MYVENRLRFDENLTRLKTISFFPFFPFDLFVHPRHFSTREFLLPARCVPISLIVFPIVPLRLYDEVFHNDKPANGLDTVHYPNRRTQSAFNGEFIFASDLKALVFRRFEESDRSFVSMQSRRRSFVGRMLRLRCAPTNGREMELASRLFVCLFVT